MESIFDQLMESYEAIRKRKYSLTEQEDKSPQDKGRQELTRRYNSMMGGTGNLPDAQKNQLKADLLQKLQVPPEQMRGTGGTYDPMYVPAQKAGSLPKVEFRTQKGTRYTLSVGGGHTGINSKTLAGAIEYLQGAISDDEGAQANLNAQPGGEQSPETQDDGTVFDANTGQEIDQTADYVPYEAQPGELEQAAQKMDGVIPGINAEDLFNRITVAPTGANTRLMKFKRSLRGGDTPWVAPEVQKEIFDAHVDLIGVAKKIKEGSYIDDSDLTPRERKLLDSFVCRNPRTNAGSWFGRRKAMSSVKRVAPNFAAYLEDMDSSPQYSGQEMYGMTMGGYTQDICSQFKDIEVRSETGDTRPAIFNSSTGGGAGNIYQVLGTKKEDLMIGTLNTFFGTESVATTVEAMEAFAQAIKDVCDLGEQIQNFVVTDGNLGMTFEHEDARVASESLLEDIDTENCNEAAVDYIKDTIKESYFLARVAKNAGVSPTGVTSKAKASTATTKADFVVEFASINDAQKFAKALSDLGAGEVSVGDSGDGGVGVSLKSQSGFDKDTPSGSSYYTPAYAYHNTPCETLSTTAQRQKCEEAAAFATTRKKFLKPSQRNVAEKAMEVDAVIARSAEAMFGSDARARASVKTTFSVLLGDVSDGDVDTLRMLSEWQQEIDTALASKDNTAIGNARINFIRRLRQLKAEQNPSLNQGFAMNDLISSFVTEEDDAMMKAMRGEIRFAGNHQIAKYVLSKAKPTRTPSGGYTWTVGKEVVFSTDLRGKTSRGGGVFYPKMEAKIKPKLFDVLATAISENTNSVGEEKIYRKLNELIEAIHVAVAK